MVVGLVFNDMAKDYYSRLSAVAYSSEISKKTINQQAEIAILILAPIILVFLVFIEFIIKLLYSERFLPINNMVHWAILGVLFQGASWAIGFIFLAKGDSKLFFWNEILSTAYILGLNIFGYHYWGLTGLGISYFITYVLHLIQVYVVGKMKYEFRFNKELVIIFVIQFVIALTCFLLVKFTTNMYSYILGTMLIIISTGYSYKELDKRLDLKALF